MVPTLERQRQKDFPEFKDRLVYTVTSRHTGQGLAVETLAARTI